jgi:hypothetical protein
VKRATLLAATLTILALAHTTTATAALQYPLHLGNRGQAVCNAQFLLSERGPPGVFRQPWYQIWKHPIRKGLNCVYTLRMKNAVEGMQWRLGYCPKGNHYKDIHGKSRTCVYTGVFDNRLRNFLTGKLRRTYAMQKAGLLRHYPPKLCNVGSRVVRLARQEIGVREQPFGSNWGPRVSTYLHSVGIYYPAYWCAAFAQYILRSAGIGPVAGSSAGVGYISDYARRHGWLRSDVKAGYLVAWGDRHIGIIDLVTGTGFYTDEGNSSNAVSRRFYRRGYLGGTLIKVPGLDRKITCGS